MGPRAVARPHSSFLPVARDQSGFSKSAAPRMSFPARADQRTRPQPRTERDLGCAQGHPESVKLRRQESFGHVSQRGSVPDADSLAGPQLDQAAFAFSMLRQKNPP